MAYYFSILFSIEDLHGFGVKDLFLQLHKQPLSILLLSLRSHESKEEN